MAGGIVMITGLDAALRDVRATRAELLPALGKALYAEAEAPFNRSQEIVPVDTAALKDSGRRHRPVIEGSSVSVELSYGGPGLDYTERQHEDLSIRHAPGKSAKFLEIPFLEAASGMAERIGQRVAREIGRA